MKKETRYDASVAGAIIGLLSLALTAYIARDEIGEFIPYLQIFLPPIAFFGATFFLVLWIPRLWAMRPYAKANAKFQSYLPLLESAQDKCLAVGERGELTSDFLDEINTLAILLKDLDIEPPMGKPAPLVMRDIVNWSTLLSILKALSMVGNLKEARRVSLMLEEGQKIQTHQLSEPY